MKSNLSGNHSHKHLLVTAVFTFFLFSTAASRASDAMLADSCRIDAQKLQATYHMTNSQIDTDRKSNKRDTAELLLWRNGDNVIQQTVDAPTSQWWHKLANGQLMLTRLFETEKRAIEYQPSDLSSNAKNSWEEKYQLLPTAYLQQLKKQKESGTGCEHTISYSLMTGDESITLEWLPKQKLIKSFQRKTATEDTQWQLISTETQAEIIENFFNQRRDYNSVDYADIGDNESDPFIRKMIHLGFIDHGASGFYIAQ